MRVIIHEEDGVADEFAVFSRGIDGELVLSFDNSIGIEVRRERNIFKKHDLVVVFTNERKKIGFHLIDRFLLKLNSGNPHSNVMLNS